MAFSIHKAIELGRNAKLKLLVKDADAKLEEANAMGFTPLQMTAKLGNHTATKTLLDAGAKADAVGRGTMHRSFTPLKIAVMAHHSHVVEVLLQHGNASADIADELGLTPLMRAICEGSIAMVRTLVQHGANVNATCRTLGGNPVLHFAAEQGDTAEFVRVLLDAGADVDAADQQGRTALHKAAEFDKVAALKELMEG